MAAYEYIKKRLNTMHGERQTWEDHWQEILDYVMPRKAEITLHRARGEKRTDVLFDSTAITAAHLLAASLQGTLTSPSLRWFSIKLRDEELNEDRDVQLWLEDTARRMYDTFNETNFNPSFFKALAPMPRAVRRGDKYDFLVEVNKKYDLTKLLNVNKVIHKIYII